MTNSTTKLEYLLKERYKLKEEINSGYGAESKSSVTYKKLLFKLEVNQNNIEKLFKQHDTNELLMFLKLKYGDIPGFIEKVCTHAYE